MDDFRNNVKKKNLRMYFWEVADKFLTEFDPYIDIVLIVYFFCQKILF